MRIPCPACQRPISFDENKLPLREVTFPCPSCKAPVTFDRRSLVPEPAAPAPQPVQSEEDPQDTGLGPNALLVGADSPALRQAARSLGFRVTHAPTADAARDLYLQDYQPLVLLSPAQLTRPPLAEMQPLTGLSPIDRRRGFFVLVADGLKTLDGTVAFLYDVNLVVAAKDLPSIARIWEEAQAQHRKLYQAFEAAVEALR
jgi:endogenous inhibitor of DNA gyrase (YacG/DUF329 family)